MFLVFGGCAHETFGVTEHHAGLRCKVNLYSEENIGCCGCCSALRPRYKRLVDNIFPAVPQDGLNKSNMGKLTFYALSSPEKLDRIGEYLYQRACRDIYRKRHGFVIIAMEAMDQLLLACHAPTLNLFVESFLKMIQKLLESTDPQLQILATESFVRFANIEEDTPSYHRRYDFFVSKFSAMCHSNYNDRNTRDSIRLAGIKGLQGVIRKTVSDDLVENIWEAQHMDKIVPSLLYNMQNAESYLTGYGSDVTTSRQSPTAKSAPALGTDDSVDNSSNAVEDPPRLAEACLRELVGRASFGHIKSVLKPVLRHFDLHELWVPNDFAIHTFKIIMFSIQSQYSYSVIENLMTHLGGEGAGSVVGGRTTRVRTAVADVLSKIIAIAAGESVGPSVLEIINNLLTHLRASVTRDSENTLEEKQYQEALINALGEFADHLPDYQKIDIMMFIVSKVPGAGTAGRADAMLQGILLKSLLKVGTKYNTGALSKAFPGSFLEPLLRLSRAPEPHTRLLLQRILHTLIDRHLNLNILNIMSVNVEEMGLNIEKCSRQDIIFINKHGPAIYTSLYEGLQLESNTVENVEAIYTTLALLVVELATEDTVCDILQLILAIQQSALSNPVLSRAQRYHLHSLVISLLALLPYVIKMPALAEYVKKIVEARQNDASHLLPSLSEDYDDFPSPSKMPYLMIDQMAICECIRAAGLDAARLQSPAPYTGGAVTHQLAHRHSWIDTGDMRQRDSLADISGGQVTDLDSASSSPTLQRTISTESSIDSMDEKIDKAHLKFLQKYPYPQGRITVEYLQNVKKTNDFWNWTGPSMSRNKNLQTQKLQKVMIQDISEKVPEEELSVEALRRAAAEVTEAERRAAEQHRAQLNRQFRTAPFQQLMRLTQPKHDTLQNKLAEIFESLSESSQQTLVNLTSPCVSAPNSPHHEARKERRSYINDQVPPYEKYFPELFLF